MADGTIRGTFDLNADPAVRGMRSIRTAGAEADVVVRRLGASLDSISGPNTTRKLNATSGNVRDIAAAAEEARVGVDALGSSLDEVGRKRAKPKVEVNGLAHALADVKRLEAALDRLDRRRATARIGVSGGFGGVPAQAAQAAAGGGGGAGGGGFPGGWKGVLGLLGLGAAAPLGGAALGIGGSAASAATGAGVVGGAGLGTLGVGLAPTVFGVKSFASEIKKAEAAQKAYNLAVAQYGAASKQAATAKQRMDAVFGQNPGAQKAIRELEQLSAAAQSSVTRPVRATIAAGAGSILRDVRTRALPTLAPGIRSDTRATVGAATTFANFATLPTGAVMTTAVAMQHEFARDVPIMERSLQNIATLFANVTRAALPYFHEANLWVQNTTAGWASWSQNTTKVNAALDHGVTSFRQWRDLATATFHLVRDLFSAGRPSGDSMIGSLATQLNTWDLWIRTNPQRVRQFFTDAERDTRRIAGAVWEIAKALGQVSSLLAPILGRMAQLVSTFGAAGLLVPTALRIGAGRLAGDRFGGIFGFGGRARGGGGAAGGGAPAGTSGSRIAGGTLVGGRRATAAEVARGQMFGGGGAFLLGPASVGAEAQIAADARQALAADARNATRLRAAERGWLARSASVAQGAVLAPFGMGRFSAREGTGLFRQWGARAAAGIRQGVARSARFVGPLLGVNAVLGGLTTPGDISQRIEGGLSAGTLGLIPTSPQPGAGTSAAQQHLANFIAPMDPHSVALRIGALRRGIAHEGGRASPQAGDLGQPHWQVAADVFGGETPAEARRHREVLRAYEGDLRRSLAIQQQMWDNAARQHAQGYSQHFGDAFNLYSKRMGPVKAMNIMRGDILGEMKTLRPAGQRVLAQNALSWMNQMQKDNPALKGQYEDLKKSIIRQFDAMGQHIAIVNGQILDGSKAEWGRISLAMSDPLELARERMQKSFTQIQLMAVGSLTAMGYKPAEARALVRGMDPQSNKAQQQAAGAAARVGPGGIISGRQNAPTGRQFAQHKATGGRIGGVGLADNVPMPDGGKAAPGELVVNRHDEAQVNMDLWRAGKLTLAQRVARQNKAHSAAPSSEIVAAMFADSGILPDRDVPFRQRGGRRRGGLGGLGQSFGLATGLASGVAAGVTSHIGDMAAMVAEANAIDAKHFPYRWGGGHNQSFSGPYDCSGAVSAVLHAGGVLASPLTSGGFMSFGQPGDGDVTLFANAGHVYMRLGSQYFGTSSQNPGGGAGWLSNYGPRPGFVHRAVQSRGGGAAGALAGGGPGSISLHGIASGLRGVPGALADRGSAIYAKGLQDKVNAKLAKMGGGGGILPGGGRGGSPAANMRLGYQMMLQAGWPASEWPALKALWTQESGWDANSVNHSSGAYGIPQALGHGHPFNLGDAGAQIAWGLNYIRGRYGSPSAAEAHERSANWYATGGRLGPSWLGWFDRGTDFTTTPGRPVMFGAGEKRRERVRIEPLSQKAGAGGGHSFHFDFSGATITSEAHAKAIGEMVVTKVIEALDRGQVPDSAVAG